MRTELANEFVAMRPDCELLNLYSISECHDTNIWSDTTACTSFYSQASVLAGLLPPLTATSVCSRNSEHLYASGLAGLRFSHRRRCVQ